ncbi:EpsG family protein [Shewanella algae]|nr:EpsG family protein [Shewanella algae]
MSGFIGTDWHNYYSYYMSESSARSNHEFGFELISNIFRWGDIPYSIFRSFIYSIQIGYLIYLCNRIKIPFSLVFIYIIFLLPNFFIDTIRNFLAVLFLIQAVLFFEKGKVKLFNVFVFIGCLFHVTTAVFFILNFFKAKIISKNKLIIILIISVISLLLKVDYLAFATEMLQFVTSDHYYIKRYLMYFNKPSEYGITFGTLEKIYFLLLVIIFYEKVTFLNKGNAIVFNFSIAYVFINLNFTLYEFMINRVAVIFSIFYLFVLAKVHVGNSRLLRFLFLPILIVATLKFLISWNNPLFDYGAESLFYDDFSERLKVLNYYYNSR